MPTRAQVQKEITKVSNIFYSNRAKYLYVQTRPMPGCINCSAAYKRLDCSSTVTEIFHEAGAPDPNGRGYDGYGYTGTLIAQGTQVRGKPEVGDLTFYGDPYGRTGHVVLHHNPNDPYAVISFGSTPPSIRDWKYRSDYDQTRRYELGTPDPIEYWLEELPWPAGGLGPKVLGPWVDTSSRVQEKKWPGARKLAENMQKNGRKVATRVIGNRFYILDYLEGTYNVQLRYGPWNSSDGRKQGREINEARLGRKLRPYNGRANSHYPIPH